MTRTLSILGLSVLCACKVEASAEDFRFAEAEPGKRLEFPLDFGSHPAFRLEWWYVTANLKDADGAPYGIQWTLFRQALEPGPEREGWANQNVWMGHAAVTSAKLHLFSETFARGGVGQAGVNAAPFSAWIDDWTFSCSGGSSPTISPAEVTASGTNFRYSLKLTTDQRLILQGDKGYQEKLERPQASYYFSQPFFSAEGFLTLNGKEMKVSGQAWMDREWTSQLPRKWEWFSLHLNSGEQLMLYRFPDEIGRGLYAGAWISADGTSSALRADDIEFTSLSETRLSGRIVPTVWRVRVKSRYFDVVANPLNADSWMPTSPPYWEGPIVIRGSHVGEGFLEMVGY